MNPVVEKIQRMILKQRPDVAAEGIVLAADPLTHTVTVEYIDIHGNKRIKRDVPVATEPGLWSAGFQVGDKVQLVFVGGNALTPIVTKRIEDDFATRRNIQWSDPMVVEYPETLDEVGMQ